jgi:hypothetical protein
VNASDPPRNRPDWADDALAGLGYAYLTSLAVVLAVVFGGQGFLKSGPAPVVPRTTIERFTQWDGRWYKSIVREGYSYRPATRSNVAFFPAYPLAVRAVMSATGLNSDWALVLVAQGSFAGACVLFYRYARERMAGAPGNTAPEFALLALAFFPAGVFFRCAYAESLFLLLAVQAMYSQVRRWPWWLSAVLGGATTAARPVGAALLAPLLWNVWSAGGTPWSRMARTAACLPLGCWGLLAYMAYLGVVFDDPLAFVEAQSNWRVRPAVPWSEEALALATLEPLWNVYVPDSPAYWGRHENDILPAFNLPFANPLYFVGAVGLLAFGAWKRWLRGDEILLTAGLLAIPYATRGYDMGMGSAGRFVSVAFPLYLVVGRILAAAPPALATAMLALSAIVLSMYAALFSAGYLVF